MKKFIMMILVATLSFSLFGCEMEGVTSEKTKEEPIVTTVVTDAKATEQTNVPADTQISVTPTPTQALKCDHEYSSEITKEPSCSQGGLATYTCQKCKDSYSKELSALEHNYRSGRVINPTCTQKGSEEYICTNCNDSYEREIPMLSHDIIGADCENSARCKGCAYTEGEALGHDYELFEVIEASCVEMGSEIHVCKKCGGRKTNEIPAKGHSFKAANCLSPEKCKECNLEQGEALGHIYSNGKCSRCSSTDGIPTLKAPRSKGFFGDKFADKFAPEGVVISNETTYLSHDISITYTRKTTQFLKGYDVVYYVYDIYIRNIENFYTVSTKNTTRRYMETVESYAADIKDSEGNKLYGSLPVLSMNGDLWRFNKAPSIVRNGVLYNYSSSIRNDIGVLYYDGSFDVISPDKYDWESIAAKEPYQIWHFGPGLLDGEGNIRGTSASAYQYDGASYNGIIGGRNPRAALGYYEPGHYCFVVVDGRCSFSIGVTIPQFARIMSDLGCKQAYNLDGGNTSQIKFNGIYGRQGDENSEQRKLDDILCIGELLGN